LDAQSSSLVLFVSIERSRRKFPVSPKSGIQEPKNAQPPAGEMPSNLQAELLLKGGSSAIWLEILK
jgi:hypothetical protein